MCIHTHTHTHITLTPPLHTHTHTHSHHHPLTHTHTHTHYTHPPTSHTQTITPVLFASIPENATSGWIAESRCICICPHNLNYTDYYNTTLFTRKVYEPAEWWVCVWSGCVYGVWSGWYVGVRNGESLTNIIRACHVTGLV